MLPLVSDIIFDNIKLPYRVQGTSAVLVSSAGIKVVKQIVSHVDR